MKTVIRTLVLGLVCVVAALAYGKVPAINVIVSDSGGKAAFKGKTDAKGTFATSKLQPGQYVVQFNTSGAPKGSHYTIVVSAGKKKVSANSVAGEKLSGGGVAMKVDVGAGINITGQVAEETGPMSKGGKKMVWIPPQLGSNKPGHWAEEGSAEAVEAKASGNLSTQDVQNLQSHGAAPGN